MSTLIKVRLYGRFQLFLVREINWAPTITVMGADAQIYVLPSGNYPPPHAAEAEAFWLELEQTLHIKYTATLNTLLAALLIAA